MKIITVIFLFLIGCVSAQKHAGVAKYNLSTVESLRLGEQTTSDVLAILGAPNEKVDLSKIPQVRKIGTVWQYNEGEYPRISVFFENNILKSVTWKVRDSDPEQSIDVVKKRYPYKWRISVVPPSTAHSSPEICRLTDSVSSLSFDVRASVRQVTLITRSLPHNSSNASFEAWKADLCGFLK